MDLLPWVDASFSLRFAAALLHFLWQGCAVAALVIVGGVIVKRATAKWRYAFHVTALLLMPACLPATFMLLAPGPDALVRSQPIEETQPTATSAVQTALDAPIRLPAEADSGELATDQAARNIDSPPRRLFAAGAVSNMAGLLAPYITTIYFAGVALLLGRLAIGVRGGHRLRRSATAVDDETLLTMAERQSRRMGLKAPPPIAWREQISIPIVVGVVKPIIVLPASLISGLSPDQLQALIAHELAHIRRFDPLMNLLQRMIEALLFFHPAVWFVSRRVSLERENACDDLVLAAGWRRLHYAEALIRMAELSSALRKLPLTHQAPVLAASGTNPSQFKRRVLRLIDGADQTPVRLTRCGLVALFAVCALLAFTPALLRTRAQSPSPVKSAESTPSAHKESQPPGGRQSPWGRLKGRLVLEGMTPHARTIRITKDQRVLGHSIVDESLMVDKKSKGIANVLVFARTRGLRIPPGYKEAVKKPKTLTFRGGHLRPRVTTLYVGQPLSIRNADEVAHNVHLQTIQNGGRNVLIPSKGRIEVSFAKRESIPVIVRDNIHAWESSYLMIADHPYMAVTDKNGAFEIPNLPPGELEFQFWHERSGWLAAKPEWKKGRFKITIAAGVTHDLGEVRVPAKLLAADKK